MTVGAEQSGPGSDRAAFMARVRGALARATTLERVAPPRIDESVARVGRADDDVAGLFARRATVAGMNVLRVRATEMVEQIVRILIKGGAQRVALGDLGVTSALLTAGLRSAGIVVIESGGAEGFAPLYDADAGITDVQAAIAETGSLVCCSGPGRGRGLSLVPPIHIAVVRKSDIVPDLIDYWASAERGGAALPSSIVLITGPSKTADIEGILITGVHGPREVHVVLVEDA